MSDHRRPSRTDRRRSRSRSPNDSRHNYHEDREFGDFFFQTVIILNQQQYLDVIKSDEKRRNSFGT
jgi:hypothetical protein